MKKINIKKIGMYIVVFGFIFWLGFLTRGPIKNSVENVIEDEMSQEKKASTTEKAIDSGIELRVDIDQDGERDVLQIRDIASGDYLYTRFSTQCADGDVAEYTFEGHYSSTIMSGDLSGDGNPEIVVDKKIWGSNYGASEVAILYYDLKNNEWKEGNYEFYDKEGNIKFTLNEKWGQAPSDVEIIQVDERIGLKLTFLEDSVVGTTRIYEAYLKKDKWYIEQERIEEI